ncbi:hypothetical protein ESCOCP332M_18365 [Escherichia coli]|nr:hypothetical protein A1WQ_03807 [Escherichia coli KTE103]GCL86977.1 hypothetical protein ExPECSC018_01882 [Escherichia coli]
MKGKSALTLLLAGIFSCGTCQATGAEVTSESVFNILNSTGAATDKSYGNDSNLLIVFYVQIMPDDFVMQLHRF